MKKFGKRIVAILGIFALICSMLLPMAQADAASLKIKYNNTVSTYQGKQITVSVNGTKKTYSTPGIQINGTNMVGAKDIFQKALGGKYSYKSSTGAITITYEDHEVKMTVGSKTAYVDGKKTSISVAPTKIYFYGAKITKIYVPAKFVATEGLGLSYQWSSSSSMIKLNSSLKVYYDGAWQNYTGTQAAVSVLNKTISTSALPGIIIDNTTLVRAKQVFASSGIKATYVYDSATKQCTITKGSKTLVFTMGSDECVVNGDTVVLPTKARIIKNEKGTSYVCVPAEFTAIELGYNYEFTNQTSTITQEEFTGLHLTYDGAEHEYTGVQGKVQVNGKTLSNGKMPVVLLDDTVMLRAKSVFSTALKLGYKYDSTGKTLTLSQDGISVVFTMGSKTAMVNGVATTMSTAARTIQNEEGTSYICVPGKFTAQAFGLNYSWNGSVASITEGNNSTSNISVTPIQTYLTLGTNQAEISRIASLPFSFGLSQSSEGVPEIKNISFSGSGTGYEEYTIVADGKMGNIFSQESEKGVLTLTCDSVTGSALTVPLSSSLVSKAVITPDKDNNTCTVTFTGTKGTQYRYELLAGSDGKSAVVRFYKNALTNVVAGKTSSYDYFLLTGLGELDYTMTTNDTNITLTLNNTQNGVGEMYQSLSTAVMPSVSVSSSGSNTVLTIYKKSTATVKTTQSGNQLLVTFTDNSVEGQLQLPSGVSFSSITTEDLYNSRKFNIIIPGNWYDYYNSNPLTLPSSAVSKVSVSIYNTNTVLTLTCKTIQAVTLQDMGSYVKVTCQKPGDVYNKIVVLDPGHGGSAPGATYGGYQEKDITLAILYTYMKDYFATGDIKVYYTRQTDTDVDLYDRADFAEEVGADYFISLHLNANDNSDINGLEVYYSSANNSTQANGITSLKMANFFEEALPDRIGISHRVNPVRQAAYVVCKYNSVPSILIELAYMTNSSDLAQLSNPVFQQNAAKQLYDRIVELFQTYPVY